MKNLLRLLIACVLLLPAFKVFGQEAQASCRDRKNERLAWILGFARVCERSSLRRTVEDQFFQMGRAYTQNPGWL